MSATAIAYHDGGHRQRAAELSDDGRSELLTLPLDGGTVRIPISTRTTGRGSRLASGAPTVAALAAYAILQLRKDQGASYGARAAFLADGRVYIGLFQQHPADRGTPTPHPGITLLEGSPDDLAYIPGAPMDTASPVLALALGAAVVTYLLLD